jgi:cytochrome P450
MTTLNESAPPRLAAPARVAEELPLWRLVFAVRRNLISYWPDAAYEADFFARRMLLGWTFTANCPEAVKHVLLDNADNYRKSVIARRLLKPGLGNGLLTSEGELWRRQRRILAPAFQAKRIASFAPTMTEATEAMLARWDAHPAETPLDIAQEMMRLTLEIIGHTMFSSDIGSLGDVIGRGVSEYQETGGRPSIVDLLNLPEWLPRRLPAGARRALRMIDEAITTIIAKRRASGAGPDDLLSLLLAARDEETGEGMSDAMIRDEIATIFTAGHETTANGLAWTWYLLALHPAVRAKLEAALDSVLGGRTPRAEDLPRLVYARMVFDEAIRLYPPAHSMSREAIADDEILGHRVPKGSTVVISPWLLHRHRKLWREPERFDPERFRPEVAAQRPRYAYLPFGGGPRVCIGMGFALQEAVLILATVAQRYRLGLAPGQEVEPIGLITLRPKGGLPMSLERWG